MMILCDVNVLLHAFHEQSPEHVRLTAWLTKVLGGEEPFGLSEQVLASVLRISTHPKIFRTPASATKAFRFCERLRHAPNTVQVIPGAKHWEIFKRLCTASRATGNLVPDAYFAALAIEHGCEWITLDRDYARFTGLRWRHPL